MSPTTFHPAATLAPSASPIRPVGVTSGPRQILPAGLRAAFDANHAALAAELQPTSRLAEILLEVVAHHASGFQLAAASETAVLGLTSRNQVAQQLYATDPETAAYAAAVGSDLVARAAKYCRQHERGLFEALHQLRLVKESNSQLFVAEIFSDEDKCITYLRRWQRDQPWQCVECGGSGRCWLRVRSKFECRCGRQYSVRAGTIYMGSQIPLTAWFTAVQAIVVKADLTTGDLVERISVVRRATVRHMVRRIQEALAAASSDRLMAGVPAHVLNHLRQMSPPVRGRTGLTPMNSSSSGATLIQPHHNLRT